MQEPTVSLTANSNPERMAFLIRNWGWLVAVGVLLVILGVVALGEAFLVTVGATWFFGVLLLLGAVGHMAHAFTKQVGGGLILEFLLGVLYAVAGVGVVMHPIQSAFLLTLMLGISIVINGILRIILSLRFRQFGSWLVMFLGGLVSVMLGTMILSRWPESSLFVIGIFIGIELITDGASFIGLGLAARAAKKD